MKTIIKNFLISDKFIRIFVVIILLWLIYLSFVKNQLIGCHYFFT